MKIDSSIAAIVTGGASGLGKATAMALAARGAKVALFDLNEEQGEQVAAAIGGVFCKVNVTDEASVDAGFAKARAAHGQERVLVSRVRKALKAAGIRLFFLPPYSPDLNPIEEVFSKLKRLLRKANERTVEATWRRIGKLLDHFPPEECANYIREAGYASI
jgi:NAD(P)-dependent dehydrogenase (short-subunit alcohol dehydrogenase family)